MKLTSEKALELLRQAKNLTPDNLPWVLHSVCVGYVSRKIAEALNLDEEEAEALGYVHDIGKQFTNTKFHGITGYEFLLQEGYDREYANICLMHSFLNNDIECTAAGSLSENTYRYQFMKHIIRHHKYTIYEKIVNLADLMCEKEVMTMEKRLINLLINNGGVYFNTVYHMKEAKKLKQYFDTILGYNVYKLFPEIYEK